MKAVILAGGGGTRLWPLSTENEPKQFHRLVSEKTMLEETIDRIDFLEAKDIYIAINEKHLDLVKKLCPQIPEKNLIIEPALRDTASCIGLAAAIIEKSFPGEIMVVIYADHLIQNKQEFKTKLLLAKDIAEKENTLNIVEVEALTPNTNYGYVKISKELSPSVYGLDRFVEKPNEETAKKFLEEGGYYWNTGIYVWKTSVLLEEYKKFLKDSYDKLIEISDSYGTDKQNEVLKNIYPTLTKISVDYAIMEKTDPQNIRIITTNNLGWSDIGNWEAIYNEISKNPEENILRGEAKQLNCSGCIIYADNNKAIKAIGLKDIVIIDTKDGLLVSTKEQSKRIKELM